MVKCMSSKVNLLALLAFLLTCCATPKVVQDYQRDSVVVIVKDSVILRDSIVMVAIPVESASSILPDSDTSRLETSLARSVAFVAGGKLNHTLTNKDALIPIKITIPEKVHSEQREKAMIYRQIETVEVEKELSRWQNFILVLGYSVLIAVVLWLINKIRKFVVK